MSNLTQWLGQFSVATSASAITVEGTSPVYAAESINVTTGRYFIAGYTSEVADQFCEHLTTQLAATTNFTSATFTYSATTGKVTFTNTGTTTTLTFNDATIAALLGFTASPYSGQATYTAENEARYGWRPDTPVSMAPNHPSNVYAPSSRTTVQRSPDGTTVAIEASAVLYDSDGRDFEYRNVNGDRVRKPDTGTTHQDFETFLEDVIHKGRKCRFYPDRTVNTSSDYKEVRISRARGAVGSFSRYARRENPRFDGLWRVRMPIVKA